MSSTNLGFVKSGISKKRYEVKWDSYSKEVYVSWGGWTYIGKANSPAEAMNKSEAWLYNK